MYGLGIRCKSCAGVPSMAECGHVTQCQDNEECFTRKIVGSVGNIMYESGCMSKQVCLLASGIVGKRELSKYREDLVIPRERRDVTACFQCCNSELCNNKLCIPNNATSNRLECYQCADVLKPSDCTQLVSCGLDYQCSTNKHQLSTNLELRYKLDCMRKVICDVAKTDSIDTAFCVQCCNDSYCNSKLCGFLDTTKPIFLLKPQDKTALPGDKVQLRCEVSKASGLSTTVTWQHRNAKQMITTAPVKLSNDNQLLSMTITNQHYGYWTCRATNKNGFVEQTVKIMPSIPNFGR